MLKLKTRFITKERNKIIIKGLPPKNEIPHLKIEVYQRINEAASNMRTPLEYHIYDDKATKDLPGVHVVVTVNNGSKNTARLFSLETRPFSLEKNFKPILTWRPEDIAKAIQNMEFENFASILGDNMVFSNSKDWEIQYYGLILDLYRKSLK